MSTPAEHRQVRELFEAALELPPAAWEAFLAQQDATPSVRLRVLDMLHRDARGTPEFSGPAIVAEIREALDASLVSAQIEGRMIGPYRIEEPLGAGGMGCVFRATRHDGEVVHHVAVKLMRLEARSDVLLRRFAIEKQALARLVHPHICRFLDAGSLPNGQPYVVMELVEGTTIVEYCDRRCLPLAARLRLFRQVLEAVGHAHRHLVLHRDIKNANVLVDANGDVKLVDFGVAKLLEVDRALSETATVERFLTPATAAPEQVLGRPATVATDIYALGVLLYQLLTGLLPLELEGLGLAEIEQRIATLPPRAPSTRITGDAAIAARLGEPSIDALRRNLRGDLDAIVLQCLRKEPQARYASCDQLDRDIAACLAGHPISLRGSERMYVVRKFIQRHRLAVVLVSCLVVTIVVALAAVAVQSLAVAEQRNLALHERDKARTALALLKEAFLSADPARVAGAEASAGQILGAAMPRIEPLAETDPPLFAALASTIAEVELGLERDQTAVELAERALLALSASGHDDRATQRSLLMTIARAATVQGRLDRAKHALESVRGLDGETRIDWQVAHGRYLYYADRPDDAIGLLRQAVAATADSTPATGDALEARWQLAEALRAAGRAAEGAAWLQQLSAEQAMQGSPAHAQRMLTRLRLVDLLTESGQPVQAEDEARALLPEVQQAYGRTSSMEALLRASLGASLYAQRRREDAIAEFENALQGWHRALGPDHLRTLRATLNLAQLHSVSPSTADKAEQYFATALDGLRRKLGHESNLVFFARVHFARHLHARQRNLEALAVLSAEGVDRELGVAGESNRGAFVKVLDGVASALGCSVAVQAAAAPDGESCSRLQRLLDLAKRLG